MILPNVIEHGLSVRGKAQPVYLRSQNPFGRQSVERSQSSVILHLVAPSISGIESVTPRRQGEDEDAGVGRGTRKAGQDTRVYRPIAPHRFNARI